MSDLAIPEATDVEVMSVDEPEPVEDYENYDSLTGFEKWHHDTLIQLLGENQALVGEVRACRSDIADLRQYVSELEQRAQEMASPEKMQEAMSKMMSGMLG